MDELFFVTHNKGKAKSAEKYFKNVKINMVDFDFDEPRSDNLQLIATSKVMQAYNYVKKPCIAMDTGFFIDALNGFPRANIHFVLDTIGLDGILKLMDGKKNRACKFQECLAYYDGINDIKYFYGESKGSLALRPIGADREEKWSDLWYLFIPYGFSTTLAQMNEEERMERRNIDGSTSALEVFARWYEMEQKIKKYK